MDRRPLYSLYSMIFVIPQGGALTSQDGPCFVLQRSIFDGITNIVEYNEYQEDDGPLSCFHQRGTHIDIYRRLTVLVIEVKKMVTDGSPTHFICVRLICSAG